jgi:hypothetical protein
VPEVRLDIVRRQLDGAPRGFPSLIVRFELLLGIRGPDVAEDEADLGEGDKRVHLGVGLGGLGERYTHLVDAGQVFVVPRLPGIDLGDQWRLDPRLGGRLGRSGCGRERNDEGGAEYPRGSY